MLGVVVGDAGEDGMEKTVRGEMQRRCYFGIFRTPIAPPFHAVLVLSFPVERRLRCLPSHGRQRAVVFLRVMKARNPTCS